MVSPSARLHRPRIVVVGASYAGLMAARALDRDSDVTVVDRSASFEWLPNIHELISGVKHAADLRLPRARLVARAGHRFMRANVSEVDARIGQVITASGRRLPFDACIVAVGGIDETHGVPGAAKYARSFKSIRDCERVRRELGGLVRQRGRASVVIVGGGLEGVEALGEILRRHRGRSSLEISVVEAASRLLPEAPPALDAALRDHCARWGVRLFTSERVTRVTRRRVYLESGRMLRSDLTLWTGGLGPSPLLLASGLVDRPRQWAPVDRKLRSRCFENVFVAGDAVALPRPLPKQAFYAMQMGERAAGNVERQLRGRPLRDFVPSPKPMLVTFGDLDTFMVAGRTVVASPALAAAKESVYQLTMAQLDSPLRAGAVRSATRRLAAAAGRLALPALSSRDTRRRLRRIDISWT
jgi:NADH dehydrogenase FAD-containing subunit